mmetsp:Transcript_38698/g.87861  ORF Transcript_38698/g.87861 Transcript_38698/m.87861 type:complete len:202 (-) Transcript_38698:64-669(-)
MVVSVTVALVVFTVVVFAVVVSGRPVSVVSSASSSRSSSSSLDGVYPAAVPGVKASTSSAGDSASDAPFDRVVVVVVVPVLVLVVPNGRVDVEVDRLSAVAFCGGLPRSPPASAPAESGAGSASSLPAPSRHGKPELTSALGVLLTSPFFTTFGKQVSVRPIELRAFPQVHAPHSSMASHCVRHSFALLTLLMGSRLSAAV